MFNKKVYMAFDTLQVKAVDDLIITCTVSFANTIGQESDMSLTTSSCKGDILFF